MIHGQQGTAVVPSQRGAQLHALVIRLFREYGADDELVDSAADDVAGRYADARINAFVPTLIEREVRALVRERAATSVIRLP